MKTLVLYQSRHGHTRAAAEAIAQAVRDLQHEAIVQSVTQVRAADIASADVLFLGTWVQGFVLFGVRPAGADLWVPALPSLEGKPVGIFCTYLFHPRSSLQTLGSLLEARGASVVGGRAFHRSRIRGGAAAFAQTVLQAAQRAAQ